MFEARYDLPLERDVTGRFLPWMIAVMAFLAMLALAGAMLLSDLAERWDSGLTGTLTVEVSPPPGGDAAEHARRVEAVVALLRASPGIGSAQALPRGDLEALLSPWLGEGALIEELPIPALIDVRLDRGAPDLDALDLDALSRRIAETVPGVRVDDHQAWLDGLIVLTRTVEVLAIAIVALVGGAAVGAVVFVARAGLAIHAPVVELLHLIGASDAYVARQFQRHVLGLAVRGALGGALLAAFALVALDLTARRIAPGLLPDLSLSPGQWATLAIVPVLAAVLAAVTARVTVLRTLARLP
ncbi:MAG TPA: hypothetical protein VK943_14920 [Arenibaculum sp.]|nr:hypothetical protein [Arenibaculum sp.]